MPELRKLVPAYYCCHVQPLQPAQSAGWDQLGGRHVGHHALMVAVASAGPPFRISCSIMVGLRLLRKLVPPYSPHSPQGGNLT